VGGDNGGEWVRLHRSPKLEVKGVLEKRGLLGEKNLLGDRGSSDRGVVFLLPRHRENAKASWTKRRPPPLAGRGREQKVG